MKTAREMTMIFVTLFAAFSLQSCYTQLGAPGSGHEADPPAASTATADQDQVVNAQPATEADADVQYQDPGVVYYEEIYYDSLSGYDTVYTAEPGIEGNLENTYDQRYSYDPYSYDSYGQGYDPYRYDPYRYDPYGYDAYGYNYGAYNTSLYLSFGRPYHGYRWNRYNRPFYSSFHFGYYDPFYYGYGDYYYGYYPTIAICPPWYPPYYGYYSYYPHSYPYYYGGYAYGGHGGRSVPREKRDWDRRDGSGVSGRPGTIRGGESPGGSSGIVGTDHRPVDAPTAVIGRNGNGNGNGNGGGSGTLTDDHVVVSRPDTRGGNGGGTVTDDHVNVDRPGRSERPASGKEAAAATDWRNNRKGTLVERRKKRSPREAYDDFVKRNGPRAPRVAESTDGGTVVTETPKTARRSGVDDGGSSGDDSKRVLVSRRPVATQSGSGTSSGATYQRPRSSSGTSSSTRSGRTYQNSGSSSASSGSSARKVSGGSSSKSSSSSSARKVSGGSSSKSSSSSSARKVSGSSRSSGSSGSSVSGGSSRSSGSSGGSSSGSSRKSGRGGR